MSPDPVPAVASVRRIQPTSAVTVHEQPGCVSTRTTPLSAAAPTSTLVGETEKVQSSAGRTRAVGTEPEENVTSMTANVDVIMEVNDRAHMVLRPFAPGLPALILRLRTDPVNMRPASRKGSPKRRRTTCVNLKLLRAIGV